MDKQRRATQTDIKRRLRSLMKIKVKHLLIKKLRLQKSWTQEDFAEVSGVHSRTIQRMENEGMVSVKTLKAVAMALEVEPYTLEFSTDEIDFAPLWMEFRILILAITRRMLPMNHKEVPNSLIAVLSLLTFSASYTLVNSIILIVSQPQKNFDSVAISGIFGVVISFCILFVAVIYPLFKLKNWSRYVMLGICGVFFLINGGLLGEILIKTTTSKMSLAELDLDYFLIAEYGVNLIFVYWIIVILTRADIKRLYTKSKLPET